MAFILLSVYTCILQIVVLACCFYQVANNYLLRISKIIGEEISLHINSFFISFHSFIQIALIIKWSRLTGRPVFTIVMYALIGICLGCLGRDSFSLNRFEISMISIYLLYVTTGRLLFFGIDPESAENIMPPIANEIFFDLPVIFWLDVAWLVMLYW